jgi:hypothetical protein
MGFQFKKATKEQAKLRLALHGPSGAGKTYSGLSIATHLIEPGQRVALLDTERGSASKYAHKFDFDVVEVSDDYHPRKCIDVIAAAAADGNYGAIVIDSGTHFWNGAGGFLNLVDAEAKRAAAKGGKFDTFGAWKAVDPIYQALVLAITSAPIHVIMTLRAKQAYEKVEENGRNKIQKVGMAPQMRDDFQYEFDVEGMLNLEHELVIGKTRCELLDGKVYPKPGKNFAETIKTWLNDGAPKAAAAPLEKPTASPQPVKAADPEQVTAPRPTGDDNVVYRELKGAIETSTDDAAVDALMATARKAHVAGELTVDEGKGLGAVANRRKAALRGEVAA